MDGEPADVKNTSKWIEILHYLEHFLFLPATLREEK